MIKEKILKIINDIDWKLFLLFFGFTEKGVEKMPLRSLIFYKKIYDINMFMSFFGACSFAAALIYEKITYSAVGYIPPNFIQLMPIIILSILLIINIIVFPWMREKLKIK